jgi:hypothetical protein
MLKSHLIPRSGSRQVTSRISCSQRRDVLPSSRWVPVRTYSAGTVHPKYCRRGGMGDALRLFCVAGAVSMVGALCQPVPRLASPTSGILPWPTHPSNLAMNCSRANCLSPSSFTEQATFSIDVGGKAVLGTRDDALSGIVPASTTYPRIPYSSHHGR